MNKKGKTIKQVERLKLVKIPQDRWDVWRDLATTVQRLRNVALAHWRHWHEDQGSRQKVYGWMNDLRAWHETAKTVEREYIEQHGPPPKDKRGKARYKRAKEKAVKTTQGPKPTCPVLCLPNDLNNAIYANLRKEFPELPAMTVATALKLLMDSWKKMPASKSVYHRWQRAIAGFGELPAYSHPQPIPLHNRHIRLVPPKNADDDWRVGLLVERAENDHGKGKNVEDVVIVQTKSKGAWRIKRALERCADPDRPEKVCGSNLVFDEKRGWYLHLVYDQYLDAPQKLDKRKRAVLEPGTRNPFALHADGREIWVGGRGRLIALQRRRLNTKRAVRNDAYREGGQGKGHGRTRFFHRLNNRLAGYKKTLTQQAAAQAVKICVEHGIGTLVFRKPTEANAKHTFLETAGTTKWRPDRWPWYLVEGCLKRACEKAGVAVKVESWECEGSGDAENPGSPRKSGSPNGDGSSGNGAAKNGAANGRKDGRKREPSKTMAQGKGRQGVAGHAVVKGE